MAFGQAFSSDRGALGGPIATSELDARWEEWRTRYREIAPEDLRAAGARPVPAARFTLALNFAMKKFDISSTARQAAFLANVAQETGDPRSGEMLGAIEESAWPYTVNRMREVFPRRFATDASIIAVLRDARDIAHPDQPGVADPVKFFNRVYGHRTDLGNRPDTNDGYDFRGRGVLGLTGRGRYIACGIDVGVDLVGKPDLVSQPLYGCLAGAWAWCSAAFSKEGDDRHPRNLNLIADLRTPEAFDKTCAGVNHGDVDALRRGIRIGGIKQRRTYWSKFQHALHQRDLRLFHERMADVPARPNLFDEFLRPTVNDIAVRPRFLRDAVPVRSVPR